MFTRQTSLSLSKTLRASLVVALASLLGASAADAATRTWKAATTGDWFNINNWEENAYPGAGDDAVITAAGASVLLTNATDYLKSLTLSGTLTFSNWNTTLSATNVTIQSGGQVTLSGPFTNSPAMSNQVNVICTNFTLDAGGSVNANGKGYAGGVNVKGNGPGGGVPADARHGPGASHGGFGGSSATALGPNPYGSITSPVEPGSGGSGSSEGYIGGNGGGAIRIAAGALITVNGTISADGNQGGLFSGGGSGGSIYLSCAQFAATNGTLSAVGGAYNGAGGSGAGGCIAIVCNSTSQQLMPIPTVVITASPGASPYVPSADIGTIYLSSSALLPQTITAVNGQVYLASSWAPNSLLISNCWIRLPQEGLQLTTTNDLKVMGSSGRLEVGGNKVYRSSLGAGYPFAFFSTNAGPRVTVGGNLILTNSAVLAFYSGTTNAVNTNGALVSVAGSMYVGSGCWVYPGSHPTNGGSVRFYVNDLTIAGANAGFDASGRGFCGGDSGNLGQWIGFGPGQGWGAYRVMGSGGGYGGKGGWSDGGNPSPYSGTYGSSNAPVDPGSGGGGRDWAPGGTGGGLVWIQATRGITQNGIIRANGQEAPYSWSGGGSGGGIYLYTPRFSGTNASASISANGGVGGAGTGGGGGGGRIGVWRIPRTSAYAGTYSTLGGSGSSYSNGLAGTTVFTDLRELAGTIMTVR